VTPGSRTSDNTSGTVPPLGPTRPARSPDVRRAWWCVVAWVLALALAFVAGEGLCGVLGFTAACLTPWWVGGTALVGALLVLAAPTATAMYLDRRARRSGDDRARLPARLLLVLTGTVVVVNVYGWAMRVLFSQ